MKDTSIHNGENTVSCNKWSWKHWTCKAIIVEHYPTPYTQTKIDQIHKYNMSIIKFLEKKKLRTFFHIIHGSIFLICLPCLVKGNKNENKHIRPN